MKIIYAYDPLCGWCYGVISVLKHIVKHEPDITIEVLSGGLFVGSPARPCQSLSVYKLADGYSLNKECHRDPHLHFLMKPDHMLEGCQCLHHV